MIRRAVIFGLSAALALASVLSGCAHTTIDSPSAAFKSEHVTDRSLASITDAEWGDCKEQARSIIESGGSGLGDTGERALYTYGGLLGAIGALMSAGSRADEDHLAEEQERKYQLYWATMKSCLRSKGYKVPDDSVEVHRP